MLASNTTHVTNNLNLRLRIPDWILLLAFCAFFFFWRLAAFGLIGADEPRYAQVAREMLERHDWITPTLGESPWLEKPPLYYWEAMVAYRIFGVSDWAARLPSALDASLLVFAVYWFLRRFRGFALDGALMLACCAGIVGYARAASTDMPLAAMFTIAMIAWFAWLESERHLYLLGFYASVGLAMLAKGPVAPLLAAAIIVIFAAARRTPKILWRSVSLSGVLVFCAIALPWYVLVQIRNPQFLRVFILEHNLARFGTNLFHHPEPFWHYLPVTLLGWVPWTVFAVMALVSGLRRIRRDEPDSFNTFLLIWIGLIVVFFSISKSKLPGYVLPAIPAGILLLANYLRERATAKPHWLFMALHGAISAALLFAALLMPAALLEHRVVWDRTDIVPLLVAIAAGIGVANAGIRKLRVATVVPHEDFHAQVRDLPDRIAEAASTLAGFLTGAAALAHLGRSEPSREAELFLRKAATINRYYDQLRRVYKSARDGEISTPDALDEKQRLFRALEQECAAIRPEPRSFNKCVSVTNNAGLAFDHTYTEYYPLLYQVFQTCRQDLRCTTETIMNAPKKRREAEVAEYFREFVAGHSPK